MRKILIFVVAGFSTRMGGFPKALAKIDGLPVIVHALNHSKNFYDNIFIICNEKTFPSFYETVEKYGSNATVRTIVTGKGDAESVYRSLKLVENEIGATFDCTFCWGDAYFSTSEIFMRMINYPILQDSFPSIMVGCAIDTSPYAYFDFYTVDGDMEKILIKKSYFKKRDGSVSLGMHDQCIFRCISSTFLACLDSYRQELGFDGENYPLSPNNEMGLLDSFSFFSKIGRPATIRLLPANSIFSFNTTDELLQINIKLQDKAPEI